jgi:hypothetical protein
MIIKENHSKSRNKNNQIYLNNCKNTKNKKNNKFNKTFTNKDPSFQTNKTLKKYIFEKLQIYNSTQDQKDKENIPQNANKTNRKCNKDNSEEIIKYKNNIQNIKVKIRKTDNHTDLVKSGITFPMNYDNIYYKKNSNILAYLKFNEAKNGNKIHKNKSRHSENDSISSSINDYLSNYNYNTINNNHTNYHHDLFPPSSMRLNNWNNTIFSKTINSHDMDIPKHNNKILSFRIIPAVSSNNSGKKNKLNKNLSPRSPYRKVGNIFSRKECQFTKNKSKSNIINPKNKLMKKSKSEKYYKIYRVNRKEQYNNDGKIKVNINSDKIKKLEGENRYLKELIKLSEDKLIMRENQLEEILMSQNQIEEQECPVPMQQIKKIDSPKTELRQNNENFIAVNNHNNISVLRKKSKSAIKGELNDYLEEPLEQTAPKPYLLQ